MQELWVALLVKDVEGFYATGWHHGSMCHIFQSQIRLCQEKAAVCQLNGMERPLLQCQVLKWPFSLCCLVCVVLNNFLNVPKWFSKGNCHWVSGCKSQHTYGGKCLFRPTGSHVRDRQTEGWIETIMQQSGPLNHKNSKEVNIEYNWFVKYMNKSQVPLHQHHLPCSKCVQLYWFWWFY